MADVSYKHCINVALTWYDKDQPEQTMSRRRKMPVLKITQNFFAQKLPA